MAPRRGGSSAAALAAVLTVAALAAGVTHSYGPGDEATRHQRLLAHRQAQERALRGRCARGSSHLRRAVAAVSPAPTRSGTDVGGAYDDKLEEEAAIDDVPETPGQWLDESFPLQFENLAFQVGENTIRRVKDAICDSGASFNVVDENTARHNEKRGGPVVTWWRSEKAEPLYAVSGAPVIVVGTCTMTILLKDELGKKWKKFNAHFFVIRLPCPRIILGVPFMRKSRMVVDVNSETVSLYHQGEIMATRVTTAPGTVESTINSVLDCTHPLAFTMEDYTIAAGAGLGVRVQLPAVYEGLEVQLLPLPDSARDFFATKRGLRLHGPVVARCGAEGYVTVRINNFSDKSVLLPAHTPVAQYLTNPEIAPKADMTVDEIIAAMKVDASSEGEEEEIRRCIREAIFKDREARRMYFSQKRIGTGVGVPPARLELTEEFKRAGKAPYLLAVSEFRGQPTLRHWLQAPHLLKITQSCGSDAELLSKLGIVMEPVFDTAVADMVIRGAPTPRGLATLFVEYVGDDLLILKEDITAELHQSLWARTPLPFFALVYAWQDVAWGVALQTRQQEILEERSLLGMAMEMSHRLIILNMIIMG